VKLGRHDGVSGSLLVAEIGNNHEGSLEVARRMVRVAAECGVHAVKFQTYRTDRFIRRSDHERYQRIEGFELPISAFSELAEEARSLGLAFISTPLDVESASHLVPIVDAFKIASGDITHFPLIKEICRSEKPVIISTGCSHLSEVKTAVEFIQSQWNDLGHRGELAVLHCVSSYPAPVEEANLRVMDTLADALRCEVGYSDHTVGALACLLAASQGAAIIEKHFTLDNNWSEFRDHALSANPDLMAEIARTIREVFAVLGNGIKSVTPSEEVNTEAIRRSIVTVTGLQAGHRIERGDLGWMRPGTGIAPGEEDRVLGGRLLVDATAGEDLTTGMLSWD
jgi:sialic acid synthase SpsE|tara:strand:+ start:4013 stop:5029 length:1017 start_codon:yes stop_codon:yes gene_type:complete